VCSFSIKIFIYRCTSIFTAQNYCSGIFFKSLSNLHVQTFPPIFGLLAIIDRNFGKLMAPPSDKNESYVVPQKGVSILKKLKTASKSAYKRQRNACSKYALLERTARWPRSVTKKTKTTSIVPSRTMHTGRILSRAYADIREWN